MSETKKLDRLGYLKIEYNAFAEWYLSPLNIEWMTDSWSKIFYPLQNKIDKIYSVYDRYTSSRNFLSDNSEEYRQTLIEGFNKAAPNYLANLKSHLDYCEEFNQRIPVIFVHEQFYLIKLGKDSYIIPTSAPGLAFTPLKDYSSISISEIHSLKAAPGAENSASNDSATSLDSVTHLHLSERQASLNLQMDGLCKDMDAVKEGKHEEVKELQAQIDKLTQEMAAKKDALMAQLNAKMQQFEEMKKQLEQQIYVLDSEIYSIRCFFGEVVDFTRLRKGARADINTPVVLYQKLHYLDEEMAKICGFYNLEADELDMFEKLIARRDDVFDTFLHAPKSIALVRLSKDGKRFTHSEAYHNMLEAYDLEHANTIGILIRDGENLYIGWTDDTRINVKEDMFYAPGENIVVEDENTAKKVENDSDLTSVASRYFIFSILSGVLRGNYENTILRLPESVDLLAPNKYVIYSTAEDWLEDNRFGSAADIIDKCNSDIQLGDHVITVQGVYPYQSSHGGGYQPYCNDRGIGDRNRTHDVSASDKTIYPINLINWRGSAITYYRKPTKAEMEPDKLNRHAKIYKSDELVEEKFYFDDKAKLSDWKSYFDENRRKWLERYYPELALIVGEPELTDIRTHYYVSLLKWNGDYVYNGGRYTERQRDSRANFELDPTEFINVEVMNSEWIKYLIVTKKVAGVRIGGREINYNYFIPYLNRMLEHVKKRETEEYQAISQHVDLSGCPMWMVELSEWKIRTRHHKIGVKYAKQFAKYLLEQNVVLNQQIKERVKMVIHYLNSKGEEKLINGVIHLQNVDNSIFIAFTESGAELKLRISGIKGIYDSEKMTANTITKTLNNSKDKTPTKAQPVNVYTDGACKGNPGPGGWGSIIVLDEKEIELCGGEKSTTNNRMELIAVLEALSYFTHPRDIVLTTDSKYVVDAIEKGWLESWKNNDWKKADKSPVANVELWKQLIVLLDKHNVKFKWIKGHAGHIHNEKCDKLASVQAKKWKA